MHEMSVAEGILQIVEEAAVQQGCARVTQIRLEIGALSGVEIDALRFCLEVVLRDGIAAGAAIGLECLPGRGRCLECGETVAIEARFDACPRCGSYRVQVTGGTEMRVRDVLVE